MHFVFSLLDRPRQVGLQYKGWWMTPKGAWPRSHVLPLKEWDRYPRSTECISRLPFWISFFAIIWVSIIIFLHQIWYCDEKSADKGDLLARNQIFENPRWQMAAILNFDFGPKFRRRSTFSHQIRCGNGKSTCCLWFYCRYSIGLHSPPDIAAVLHCVSSYATVTTERISQNYTRTMS